MDTAAVDTRAVQAAAGRGLPTVSWALGSLAPVALAAGALLPGVLALAFGGVIAMRRLVGAAPVPPGPAAVLLSCAVGMVLVWLSDLATRAGGGSRSTAAPAALVSRLGLLVSLAAVAIPPRWSPAGEGAALVVAAACATMTLLRGMTARPPHRPRHSRPPPSATPLRSHHAAPPASFAMEGSPLDAAPGITSEPADDGMPTGGGSLTQRFERFALPDGGECVRGRLHVLVPAGSRVGAGHVGFCPPLAVIPAIQVATDYDAVEAIVTAAEVLPWGARIECRLDEPAEQAIAIPVDLSARTPS